MRHKYSGVYRDGSGNIVSSGTVSVYLAGTTTAASIYTSSTSTTAVNSTTSGTDGSFTFYVDRFDYDRDQRFKIVLSKSGFTTNTYDYIDVNNLITGTYTISTDKTVTTNLGYIPYGVIYSVDSGKTLTLSGYFEAGVYQIFSGSGTVTISCPKVLRGYPEWWGAVVNTGADCTSSITSCFATVPITQLQAADYYVTTTLKLNVPGRTLTGAGPFYNGVTGDSTRIISLSGSANVIQIGPDSQPATINDHTIGIVIENLEVSRAVAPVISSGCAGILSRWTLYQRIENVKSVESIIGFYYWGTVAAHTNKCWSFRSSAGTGAGTDYWYGYYIKGATGIAASGGNASIYFLNNNANNVIDLGVYSDGFYIDDLWADTFLTNPEATGCATGIHLEGNSSATYGYGETDLHIIKATVDAFTVAGIYIHNLSKYGTVNIQGGFAAPYGTGTPTGTIYVNGSVGSTTITGFQHICGSNTSMTGGLVIVDSKNVTSIGNVYTEATGIPVAISGSSNCHIADRAINHTNVADAVFQSSNGDRNKIDMSSYGATDKFTLGYSILSTTSEYNEFNCTGLDPSSIVGGSANKLVINGSQVTTTGLSGNNLVSGVMN